VLFIKASTKLLECEDEQYADDTSIA